MTQQRIVIASNNGGKLREIRTLLADKPVMVLPQAELGVDDAEETGLSFVENAIIKARHASAITGLPAIADDSGIEVDVLRGEPGIRSARYAGEGAGDEENLALLFENLGSRGNGEISARFHCTLVYMDHDRDPTPVIAQANWEGYIINEPRGENGFGYDPIFYLPEYGCTSAELPSEVKNRISHRGQALGLLLELLCDVLGREVKGSP